MPAAPSTRQVCCRCHAGKERPAVWPLGHQRPALRRTGQEGPACTPHSSLLTPRCACNAPTTAFAVRRAAADAVHAAKLVQCGTVWMLRMLPPMLPRWALREAGIAGSAAFAGNACTGAAHVCRAECTEAAHGPLKQQAECTLQAEQPEAAGGTAGSAAAGAHRLRGADRVEDSDSRHVIVHAFMRRRQARGRVRVCSDVAHAGRLEWQQREAGEREWLQRHRAVVHPVDAAALCCACPHRIPRLHHQRSAVTALPNRATPATAVTALPTAAPHTPVRRGWPSAMPVSAAIGAVFSCMRLSVRSSHAGAARNPCHMHALHASCACASSTCHNAHPCIVRAQLVMH
jgi:hypothetical protein